MAPMKLSKTTSLEKTKKVGVKKKRKGGEAWFKAKNAPISRMPSTCLEPFIVTYASKTGWGKKGRREMEKLVQRGNILLNPQEPPKN